MIRSSEGVGLVFPKVEDGTKWVLRRGWYEVGSNVGSFSKGGRAKEEGWCEALEWRRVSKTVLFRKRVQAVVRGVVGYRAKNEGWMNTKARGSWSCHLAITGTTTSFRDPPAATQPSLNLHLLRLAYRNQVHHITFLRILNLRPP